jgi:hypothetical protein
MIVALSALAVSIAVPVSSPAAWGAQSRQASRQEQDPETRIARPERPELGTSEVGETIQTPNYAPTDFAGAMFAPANAPSAQGLATPLAAVAEAFATGGSAAAASYASRHGIAWRGGSVLVRVDAGQPVPGRRVNEVSSRAIVDEVLVDLAEHGARVRNVLGPHIEAWVPVGELPALGLRPLVRGVRRPWRMRPSVTSEGLQVVGADPWQGVEFRSPTDGLSVGVIDLSFTGWEALRGNELPPEDRLFTRSFRDDGDLESGDEHGTAVAEIIYDFEDSMTLYLTAIETGGDINEAITYLIENGVDVINMSLGCVGCAPGDGRGAIIDVVERAPQAGIPFVTSAGNEADRHWIGPFVDNDGDGLHDFAPSDESNSFPGDQGDEVIIVMNWDFANWFSSSQDLDLLLLDSNGNIVDQSRNRQAGLSGQEAVEEIIVTLPFSGTFHVVVQNIQTTSPQRFEIYIDQRGLEYVVAEESLSVPADGAQVVAVGAIRWSTLLPEEFSSHGPTKDGRRKPDMAGPDGVSTRSFGPLNFFGTSAAGPHVAGAVALLRGRLGLLSGSDAFLVLIPRLIDVPPTGPDNITGGGRVFLLPPS